jgi:hypothetical protein
LRLITSAAGQDLLKQHPAKKAIVLEKDDLVECAITGSVENFHDLLSKVPDDFLKTFEDEKDGATLLHFASRAGNLPIIKYILGTDFPIDFQSRQHGVARLTPLMESVRSDSLKATKLLLTYGAQIPKLRCAAGKSVMDYATDEMKLQIRSHVLDLRAGKIEIPKLAPPPTKPHSIPRPNIVPSSVKHPFESIAAPSNQPNQKDILSHLARHPPQQAAPSQQQNGAQLQYQMPIYPMPGMGYPPSGFLSGPNSQLTLQMQMAQMQHQHQFQLQQQHHHQHHHHQHQHQHQHQYQHQHQPPPKVQINDPSHPLHPRNENGPSSHHPRQQQGHKNGQHHNKAVDDKRHARATQHDRKPTKQQIPTSSPQSKDHARATLFANLGKIGGASQPGATDSMTLARSQISNEISPPSSQRPLASSNPMPSIKSFDELIHTSDHGNHHAQQQSGTLPPFPMMIPPSAYVGLHPNVDMPPGFPMHMPLVPPQQRLASPQPSSSNSQDVPLRMEFNQPLSPQSHSTSHHSPEPFSGAQIVTFAGSEEMYGLHPDLESLPPNELAHELWNMIESLKEDHNKVVFGFEGKITQARTIQTSKVNECTVCWENEVRMIAIPCGHFIPCESCIKASPQWKDTCMVCKSHTRSLQKVFFDQ